MGKASKIPSSITYISHASNNLDMDLPVRSCHINMQIVIKAARGPMDIP
jgi:hypothetical protein